MAVLERLAFLQQLPVLLKGTSDDDTPCPGYLFEEMAKISHESPGSSQCLLEYLLTRLQSNSCYVKIKVLKILLYLCSHGPDLFIRDLRRNVAFIQEAAGVGGPPDPLHGISMYQRVRSSAQDLVSALFSDPPPHTSSGITAAKEKSQTGMGSQAFRPHNIQGFGYSQDKSGSGTAGEALLSGIQRAAVAVTQAVLVGGGSGSLFPPGDPADNAYKPVTVPLSDGLPPTARSAPGTNASRGCHRSGVAGGGWDDSDSGHSSQDSLQEKSSRSLSSDTGSNGQSRGGNREGADTAERAEVALPGDCLQEAQLVASVTRGQKPFLSQEEVRLFIRGCSRLNCEVVFEMLSRSMDDEDPTVKLRCMCAIASLMTSDLLSHDHMLGVVRAGLQRLSAGPAGPVMDKAKKILLQFEALTRGSPNRRSAPPPLLSSPPTTPPRPLDLLNDAIPQPTTGGLLTPSSPPPIPSLDSLTPPPCCGLSVNGSLPEESQSTDSVLPPANEIPSRPLRCADEPPPSRSSLFDGMELLTPRRSTTKTSQPPDPATVLLTAGGADAASQHRTAKPGLASAFSFLNT